MDNSIKIYKGNTFVFTVEVSAGFALAAYAGILTVKDKFDGTSYVSNVGSLDASTYTFTLSYTDTSINNDKYIYDIIIDNSTNRYTVLQDYFDVTDSVKF